MLLFGHGFSIHYDEVEPPPGVDVALVAPEGPRPPRPPPVPRRLAACPGLIAVAPGRERQRAGARARLRQGHRLHARRRHRDDVQGRDRDRPLRRAGRALRRRLRARPGGLRDARRGRLRPADGVLRVPARAQADRRPHVREGPRRDALLDLQHGRVRRLHARQARDHRRDARGDEQILDEIQSGDFAREWIAENRAGQENFQRMRAEQAATPGRARPARSCARTWTGSRRSSTDK